MLNELANEIYKNAVDKGFYENGAATNVGERMALIHSEVSEALEADRKKKYAGNEVAMLVNQISNPKEFEQRFRETVKDTHEDELADVIIRALDHAAFKGIDIDAHVRAKMRFNSMREYKHGKAY